LNLINHPSTPDGCKPWFSFLTPSLSWHPFFLFKLSLPEP
jgi:hypothetical protein